MCVEGECVHMPRSEVSDPPGAEIIGNCELPDFSARYQIPDQYILLKTEPFLQPLTWLLSLWYFVISSMHKRKY